MAQVRTAELSGASRARSFLQFLEHSQMHHVCMIDVVNSTRITAELSETQIGEFYGIFLNTTDQHVQSYGGTTIKSTGDGLLFSFPDSAQRRSGRPASERALECCVAMTESYRHMAVAFMERSLEPIKYRISAAYGPVRVARIAACPGNDIFGSTVNRCAKLNCAAPTNGLVIDEDFYGNVESSEGYRFQWTQDKACGYDGYVVRRTPRFGRLGLVP